MSRWMLSTVALLVVLNAGWMLFDGIHALVVGDYVTPGSGRLAGQLGPWSKVVRAVGIDPRSTPMKCVFVAYGASCLLVLAAFLGGVSGAWAALIVLAFLGLWHLPFGTLINVLVIVLLLYPRLQGGAGTEELPPIGTIDFFGLRTISEDRVRQLLPFEEGDPIPGELPESLKSEIEKALGIARLSFDFVCCNADGQFEAYVGIEETSGPGIPHYPAPTGNVTLPAEIVTRYEACMDQLAKAVLAGRGGEDRGAGHALSNAEPVRRIQETFVEYASAHRELLLDVLRHSSDPTHRAVAAHVLGYAPDKRDVVEPLSRAVLDPDEGVRNNATRALAVIAGYASDNPEAGITLRPDPFIGLLGSAVWSDRNKGLAVLDPLTVRRDPDLLDELRRRSLPSLVEMCRWKNWGHALGACVILRRVVGLPDDFDPASREETIAAATRPVR